MGIESIIDKGYTVLIRKWDIVRGKHIPPTRKNYDKQMKTVYRKMKRVDKNVIKYYSIEKDEDRSTYHVHALIFSDDIEAIREVYKKYISGFDWIKRYEGGRTFDECNSKFGLVHISKLEDMKQFTYYISKEREYIILNNYDKDD